MVRPDSRRTPRIPRYLGVRRKRDPFRLRGCHPLRQAVPGLSARGLLCNFLAYPAALLVYSHYPGCATAASYSHAPGLGSSAFARRYLRNHWPTTDLAAVGALFVFFSSGYLDVSVRPVARRSRNWLAAPPGQALPWPGCPIRVSPDQRMFAPPRSVSPLTAPFFGPLPQGIHHTPFVA